MKLEYYLKNLIFNFENQIFGRIFNYKNSYEK